MHFLQAQQVKNLSAMQETQEMQVPSLDQEDPLKEEWQPTPVFLLGKPQGLGSLAGYNPMGRKESDTIERLSTAHQICRKLIQFSSPIDATWNSHLGMTRVPSHMSARLFSRERARPKKGRGNQEVQILHSRSLFYCSIQQFHSTVPFYSSTQLTQVERNYYRGRGKETRSNIGGGKAFSPCICEYQGRVIS